MLFMKNSQFPKLAPENGSAHEDEGNDFLIGGIGGAGLTLFDTSERGRQEDEVNKLARQLEWQSRLFNTTLTSIRDFAYIFDRDGRFLYANQPLLDLLEITHEEIVGKNFFDLNYPPDLAARLQKQIREVFDTGKTVKDETPFTSAAGASGFYEYIFTPVFARDGAAELVAGSTRDITDRKRAEIELRDSENFARSTLNSLTPSIAILDRDGIIVDVNDNWVRFAEENQCSMPQNGIGENYLDAARQAIASGEPGARLIFEGLEAVLGGHLPKFEYEYPCHSPTEQRWFFMNVSLLATTKGGAVVSHNDITTRRQAEEALRTSEERLQLILESVEDYAIFTFDLDGAITRWNKGAENVFGFSSSEAVGQNTAIIFTPEDRERQEPEKEVREAVRSGRGEDERWHIRKNGSRFYVSGVVTPLRGADGELFGYVKVARDLTEQRRGEEQLRLAQEELETRVRQRTVELASSNESLQVEMIERKQAEDERVEILHQLVTAQENERRRISRDLHDQLGQQLTALRLKLALLKKNCDVEALCKQIDQAQAIAERIDADVDFLAWELRPTVLDDIGIAAALADYAREWSTHFDIPTEFNSSRFGKSRLAPKAETNLYRITQEALNNVYKHARAKSVDIFLERRDGFAVLIIEDDGIGFEPDKQMTGKGAKGMGLIGMHERAALIGGTIEIESAKGGGTTVYARVPMANGKKEKNKERKK